MELNQKDALNNQQKLIEIGFQIDQDLLQKKHQVFELQVELNYLFFYVLSVHISHLDLNLLEYSVIHQLFDQHQDVLEALKLMIIMLLLSTIKRNIQNRISLQFVDVT
ncbi:unnamed protein product [Paramecium sonneborni]|uniref:Uncharacterized protein n=1 Tax=Paramecium sonneborni TaxID=65129 RepID=A0A8S1N648_9CILI|nr:unnamed protein product [Paramecium sonneborni]